jgi:hypothetical protein
MCGDSAALIGGYYDFKERFVPESRRYRPGSVAVFGFCIERM